MLRQLNRSLYERHVGAANGEDATEPKFGLDERDITAELKNDGGPALEDPQASRHHPP